MLLRKGELTYKPGSVEDNHSSGSCVTATLKRPTRIHCGPQLWIPIWPCSGRGLPCHNCYQLRGALLPHPFTLTCQSRRFAFCCTFRRLSPPRRYLAPCPMEPGLSSLRQAKSDCPVNSGLMLRTGAMQRNAFRAISHPHRQDAPAPIDTDGFCAHRFAWPQHWPRFSAADVPAKP